MSNITTAVSVSDVKERLVGLDNWLIAANQRLAQYDDTSIENATKRACRQFERETKFRVNQIQVYSMDDGLYSGASNSISEDAYPYYPDSGQNFFRIDTKERPIVSVDRFRFMISTTQTSYLVPPEWIRLDKRSGTIFILPVTGNATIAAASWGLTWMAFLFGNKNVVPDIISVDYKAGLPTDWYTKDEWLDLKYALADYAALFVLNDISHTFDAGINQKSLSQDSFNQNVVYTRFQDRKMELERRVKEFQTTLRQDRTPILFGVL